MEWHAVSVHKARKRKVSADGTVTVGLWPAQAHFDRAFFSFNGRLYFPVLFKTDDTYFTCLKVRLLDDVAMKND
jgi:hypothetical protein